MTTEFIDAVGVESIITMETSWNKMPLTEPLNCRQWLLRLPR